MLSCREIVNYLDQVLRKEWYPAEIPGIWRDTSQPVYRIGLALEPDSGWKKWAQKNKVEVLFLHRPWKLPTFPVADQIGILSYHLPFDEQLTIGYNPFLAKQLQMQNLESFGSKEGRALGMIGYIPSQPDVEFCKVIQHIFGGVE